MNFMQLLQSLDDLLYEVMGWLVFFPITLWRTITRPLKMMDYADRELNERPELQYDDTLSPPLFLLLALLLSHSLGLAFGAGVNPIVARTTGLAVYIDSDAKLLLLRMVFFSIVPLAIAVALLIGLRQPVTRQRLRAPFYAQCYPAAAFALIVALGGELVHQHSERAGSGILIAALLGYCAVQTVWFHRHLRRSLPVAACFAAASLLAGMAIGIGFALLFA